jgi:hypothetical protein
MATKRLLDRLSEPLDRLEDLCDRFFDFFDQKEVPEAVHKWWIVTNSTMTHMVITDQERCIVIAPTVWNKFIGMNLDRLLETTHAQATKIPGPHPEGSRRTSTA